MKRSDVTLSVPINPEEQAFIRGRWPMTEEAWQQFMAVITAMKPGLVGQQGWPEAVSDGLTLPCADCGEVPRFDYRVTAEFWARWVPGPERLGVVCLPCLDRRSGGIGLADALIEIQWTGTAHTVVLRPTLRHEYEVAVTDSATQTATEP